MFDINNRRYLGSKYKLLNFINQAVEKHCLDCTSFLDLFGGTGVVGAYFNKKYDLIINDILTSNNLVYQCFFGNEPVNLTKLEAIIADYNQLNPSLYPDNYYSQNFADTYLSKSNMRKVGVIRDNVEAKFDQGEINQRERSVLLTSLIYAIDRIANTVGHYDAFRKSGELNKELVLGLPAINSQAKQNNRIYQMDANQLVKEVRSDIVYIDPPYNSRQYCDSYHFLENLAENKKSQVTGVAKKFDRSHLKSNYCTNKAVITFKELIENIQAKYILVSYNNTGNKINSRSNAKISDKQIIEILERKGKVFVYEQDFNAYTTGKSEISDHKERLFVCEVTKETNISSPTKPEGSEVELSKLKQEQVKQAKQLQLNQLEQVKEQNSPQVIKSPLNYIGGKSKLLPQIQSKLPTDIEVFYDIFSGGANVGVNIEAQKVYCVDNNQAVINLLKYFQTVNYQELVNQLENKIREYGLSDSFRNGYEFYQCNSGNGLGSFNKQAFTKLKHDYNQSKVVSSLSNDQVSNDQENLLFFLLIIYSFNNQIRFNRAKEFNLPVGKRDFNASLRKKLELFVAKLQQSNLEFQCKDFRELDIEQLAQEKAFLYLDPPYLLATASYNENNGWTVNDEKDLLEFLQACHSKGVRFALSNVLQHKGQVNQILLDWCLENSFNINYLDFDYRNSNYQKKDREQTTKEVLITNY
ncbi:hypothetical protein CKF54_04215 [Psittacicella hinzii]|uniref:Site-specific DNA-methyltransferase (adenine-specific) n=1 Tax=Psittacicella hinzii TaxID=2028575 RepID=A0A3A1Y355_9GAMM|nr:Dam family site-specific DNA-(adenine-N6)-methyltransferase [Psittacicella hinzii]RIY32762.1 hypothetical protein CKF54_04215 [Psittacicella hinzii]